MPIQIPLFLPARPYGASTATFLDVLWMILEALAR